MFAHPCLSGLRGVRAACAACAPLVVPAVVPVCCCFLILVDCRPSMAMASMIHNTVPSAAPDGAPANTPEISHGSTSWSPDATTLPAPSEAPRGIAPSSTPASPVLMQPLTPTYMLPPVAASPLQPPPATPWTPPATTPGLPPAGAMQSAILPVGAWQPNASMNAAMLPGYMYTHCYATSCATTGVRDATTAATRSLRLQHAGAGTAAHAARIRYALLPATWLLSWSEAPRSPTGNCI